MSSIILQPTSNKDAYKHYLHTIKTPVNINEICELIDDETKDKIISLYPAGTIHVWGVTNGKNDINYKKWCKIRSGDFIMFAAKKCIFSSGITTFTFKNRELAEYLWGKGKDGEVWENIYLVDELKNENMSYADFNSLAGYKATYVIQGFNVLDEKRSERIINRLQLYSNYYAQDISQNEYKSEIEKLMNSSLDTITRGTSRKEQNYLRKKLFRDKKQERCSLCGEVLPVDLLVTAHIKRRTDCTIEERLDVENIVIPMCKLGCDDLYEKGYLLVENGNIKINNNKVTTARLDKYLGKLNGRKCIGWKESMQKYFNYHNTNISR